MPAKPRYSVTTEELLVAGGMPREVLYKWVAQKLLARPNFTTSARGVVVAVWPREAVEQVRFIVKMQREGLALSELVDLMHVRWPAER